MHFFTCFKKHNMIKFFEILLISIEKTSYKIFFLVEILYESGESNRLIYRMVMGRKLWFETKILAICNFPDINECMTREHNCHEDATCNNTKGSWNCSCNQGYAGNGTNCEGILILCAYFHILKSEENMVSFDWCNPYVSVYGLNTEICSLIILFLTCFTQLLVAYSEHSRTTFYL